MTKVYYVLDIYIGFGLWRVMSRSCLMDPEGEWESTLMDLEGEKVKRIDISNDSNNMDAVVMADARNGICGDGANEMTATAAAQAWIVIRRWQTLDKIVIRRRQQ